MRTVIAAVAGALLTGTLSGAQSPGDPAVPEVFATRLEAYVQMHRRIEGPVPPLEASQDMNEVQRLMKNIRAGVLAERRREGQGHLFTPAVTRLLRQRIASCLTRADIREIEADLDEHTPVGMPMPRVNAPLPLDAPFIQVPPQLIARLPALPAELRYVILAKALLIWDHHADLVVDLAPKLFDHRTYTSTDD